MLIGELAEPYSPMGLEAVADDGAYVAGKVEGEGWIGGEIGEDLELADPHATPYRPEAFEQLAALWAKAP